MELESAYDFFNILWSDELFDLICEESTKYSGNQVTIDELKAVFGKFKYDRVCFYTL